MDRIPETTGSVIHWAARYDLLLWVLTLGRERRFRESILRHARLQRGESLLDVGCGTGTLAIVAKEHVGPAGTVAGIDPSPEMIARAARKARKAGVDVAFKLGVAEALPFPDAEFDVVSSTVMLHHLPAEERQRCAREMRRVLRPNGRALVVDFAGSWDEPEHQGIFKHIHSHVHGGGRGQVSDVKALLESAGLQSIETGSIGIKGLLFVLATA